MAAACVPWMLVVKPLLIKPKATEYPKHKSISSDVRKPLLAAEIEMVILLKFLIFFYFFNF